MLFSFKQFEDTKNGLIKQFQQQPPIDIQAFDSSQTIHEYNKLLNQIKYAKTNKKDINRFNLTSARTQRNTRNMPKSATYRKLNNMSRIVHDGTMRNSHTKQSDFKKQQNHQELKSINNTMRGDLQQNFYLTSLCENAQPNILRLSLNKDKQKQKYFTNVNSQTSHNIEFNQNQDEENKQQKLDENFQQLVDLRVKIFEFLKHQKYLYGQISQIQQSIRYYRGLNNDLQNKIEQQKKKHTIALNSVLKKQSDLNAVDGRNKFIKQKFQATQRFFAKSLKSIQINRNSQSKKCTQMIDDITQKILTAKYLKQKIESQKQQIKKLEQKGKYKNNRIQQSKNMHIYAEILLKVQNIVKFIKNNQYGNMQQLQFINKSIHNKSINKTIITDPQTIKNLGNSSRVRTPSKNQPKNDKKILIHNHNKQFQQTNFLKLTKQLLKIYTKLTSDEQKLKQTYQYKINQLQINRKNLYNYCSQNNKLKILQTNQDTIPLTNQTNHTNHKKILQISPYSKQFQQQMQKLKSNIKQQNKLKKQICINVNKYKKWNYTDKLSQKVQLQQIMNKQQQKLKKINQTLISIQDRCKFFIKKQIRYLQNIIQKWLKFDQSAINSQIQIINKFIKIQTHTKQQLLFSQSKDILIQFFQNWQHYLFFIQQIHNNPFLSRSLCKNKLKQMLKRIIKTKLYNPSLITQKIMIKCLKQYNKQRIYKNMQTIKILIMLGLQIYQYASKYQVLIVNSYDNNQGVNMMGTGMGTGIGMMSTSTGMGLRNNDNNNTNIGQQSTNIQNMYSTRTQNNQRMNILQKMLSITQDKQLNKFSQNNQNTIKPLLSSTSSSINKQLLKSTTKISKPFKPHTTTTTHHHNNQGNTQYLRQINHISSSLQQQTLHQNQLEQLYQESEEDDDSGILINNRQKEKQKEGEIPALVNLILAYQFQLNKLPRVVNGNVVKVKGGVL